jgi:Raf kinase inhibitor-like YbhB/YbcL family protein
MGRGGGDAQAGPIDGVKSPRACVLAAAALGAAIVIAACGGGASSSSTTGVAPTSTTATNSAFHLTSTAFAPGGPIPRAYTCNGPDVSLPLRWSGVPRGTRELVLIMRDPDAPGGNFIHWAVAGIAPGASGVAAGRAAALGTAGRNGFGTVGYRGPCPPAGPAHHYVITLSALSGRSDLAAGFTAGQLRTAALGVATLVGTYGRR